MAKYYFLLLALSCGLYGGSQECNSYDLLSQELLWSGDLERFQMTLSKGWQLADSVENNSSLEFVPEQKMTDFHILFSLDFPPSTSNRLEIILHLAGPENSDSGVLTMAIGESGTRDGLTVNMVTSDNKTVNYDFWSGNYGGGADHSSLNISLTEEGIIISSRGGENQETIPWLGQMNADWWMAKIALRCHYTKTRSSHFFFHQLYGGVDFAHQVVRPRPGEIFISEFRQGQKQGSNFIELFSGITKSGCLMGLGIEISGHRVNLPPLTINPGGYIVLQESNSFLDTDPSAQVIHLPMPDLQPYTSLDIVLYYYDRVVHGVRHTPESEPMESGSVEMIDISQPCRTDNWAVTTSDFGSPGTDNTHFSTLNPPELNYVWVTPTTAEVQFPHLIFRTDGMDQLFHSNLDFEIDDHLWWGKSKINFLSDPDPGQRVEVTVKGEMETCFGPVLWDTLFISSAPVRGGEQGLLISELMYEPLQGCPEYLEITNMEEWATWWDGLVVQKNDRDSVSIPVDGGWPGLESRLFTSDRNQFLDCYPEVKPELVYELDLFALNNNGANLVLTASDPSRRLIDKISYSPGLHNFLIKNSRGVSLERNIFGTMGNKWRSGFVQFGYRSPGFLPIWDLSTGIDVEFSTPVIYIGDGREPSRLEISVGSQSLSGSITIEIFDLNGRKVQTLANSVPVQGGDVFYWPGRLSNGQLLPEGLYLFWVYYFDSLGHRKTLKKTCVLSNN